MSKERTYEFNGVRDLSFDEWEEMAHIQYKIDMEQREKRKEEKEKKKKEKELIEETKKKTKELNIKHEKYRDEYTEKEKSDRQKSRDEKNEFNTLLRAAVKEKKEREKTEAEVFMTVGTGSILMAPTEEGEEEMVHFDGIKDVTDKKKLKEKNKEYKKKINEGFDEAMGQGLQVVVTDAEKENEGYASTKYKPRVTKGTIRESNSVLMSSPVEANPEEILYLVQIAGMNEQDIINDDEGEKREMFNFGFSQAFKALPEDIEEVMHPKLIKELKAKMKKEQWGGDPIAGPDGRTARNPEEAKRMFLSKHAEYFPWMEDNKKWYHGTDKYIMREILKRILAWEKMTRIYQKLYNENPPEEWKEDMIPETFNDIRIDGKREFWSPSWIEYNEKVIQKWFDVSDTKSSKISKLWWDYYPEKAIGMTRMRRSLNIHSDIDSIDAKYKFEAIKNQIEEMNKEKERLLTPLLEKYKGWLDDPNDTELYHSRNMPEAMKVPDLAETLFEGLVSSVFSVKALAADIGVEAGIMMIRLAPQLIHALRNAQVARAATKAGKRIAKYTIDPTYFMGAIKRGVGFMNKTDGMAFARLMDEFGSVKKTMKYLEKLKKTRKWLDGSAEFKDKAMHMLKGGDLYDFMIGKQGSLGKYDDLFTIYLADDAVSPRVSKVIEKIKAGKHLDDIDLKLTEKDVEFLMDEDGKNFEGIEIPDQMTKQAADEEFQKIYQEMEIKPEYGKRTFEDVDFKRNKGAKAFMDMETNKIQDPEVAEAVLSASQGNKTKDAVQSPVIELCAHRHPEMERTRFDIKDLVNLNEDASHEGANKAMDTIYEATRKHADDMKGRKNFAGIEKSGTISEIGKLSIEETETLVKAVDEKLIRRGQKWHIKGAGGKDKALEIEDILISMRNNEAIGINDNEIDNIYIMMNRAIEGIDLDPREMEILKAFYKKLTGEVAEEVGTGFRNMCRSTGIINPEVKKLKNLDFTFYDSNEALLTLTPEERTVLQDIDKIMKQTDGLDEKEKKIMSRILISQYRDQQYRATFSMKYGEKLVKDAFNKILAGGKGIYIFFTDISNLGGLNKVLTREGTDILMKEFFESVYKRFGKKVKIIRAGADELYFVLDDMMGLPEKAVKTQIDNIWRDGMKKNKLLDEGIFSVKKGYSYPANIKTVGLADIPPKRFKELTPANFIDDARRHGWKPPDEVEEAIKNTRNKAAAMGYTPKEIKKIAAGEIKKYAAAKTPEERCIGAMRDTLDQVGDAAKKKIRKEYLTMWRHHNIENMNSDVIATTLVNMKKVRIESEIGSEIWKNEEVLDFLRKRDYNIVQIEDASSFTEGRITGDILILHDSELPSFLEEAKAVGALDGVTSISDIHRGNVWKAVKKGGKGGLDEQWKSIQLSVRNKTHTVQDADTVKRVFVFKRPKEAGWSLVDDPGDAGLKFRYEDLGKSKLGGRNFRERITELDGDGAVGGDGGGVSGDTGKRGFDQKGVHRENRGFFQSTGETGKGADGGTDLSELDPTEIRDVSPAVNNQQLLKDFAEENLSEIHHQAELEDIDNTFGDLMARTRARMNQGMDETIDRVAKKAGEVDHKLEEYWESIATPSEKRIEKLLEPRRKEVKGLGEEIKGITDEIHAKSIEKLKIDEKLLKQKPLRKGETDDGLRILRDQLDTDLSALVAKRVPLARKKEAVEESIWILEKGGKEAELAIQYRESKNLYFIVQRWLEDVRRSVFNDSFYRENNLVGVYDILNETKARSAISAKENLDTLKVIFRGMDDTELEGLFLKYENFAKNPELYTLSPRERWTIQKLKKWYDSNGEQLKALREFTGIQELWPDSDVNRMRKEIRKLQVKIRRYNLKTGMAQEIKEANTEIAGLNGRINDIIRQQFAHHHIDPDDDSLISMVRSASARMRWKGRKAKNISELPPELNPEKNLAMATAYYSIEATRSYEFGRMYAKIMKEGFIKLADDAPKGWVSMGDILPGFRCHPRVFKDIKEMVEPVLSKLPKPIKMVATANAWMKTNSFYLQTILWTNDLFQYSRVRFGPNYAKFISTIPEAGSHYHNKSALYYKVRELGLFGDSMKMAKNQAKAFKTWLKKNPKSGVMKLLSGYVPEGKNKVGYIFNVFDEMFHGLQSTGWDGDSTIRIAGVMNEMRIRKIWDMASPEFAQIVHEMKREFGDYGRIRDMYRTLMNIEFYTPTFTTLMLNNQGDDLFRMLSLSFSKNPIARGVGAGGRRRLMTHMLSAMFVRSVYAAAGYKATSLYKTTQKQYYRHPDTNEIIWSDRVAVLPGPLFLMNRILERGLLKQSYMWASRLRMMFEQLHANKDWRGREIINPADSAVDKLKSGTWHFIKFGFPIADFVGNALDQRDALQLGLSVMAVPTYKSTAYESRLISLVNTMERELSALENRRDITKAHKERARINTGAKIGFITKWREDYIKIHTRKDLMSYIEAWQQAWGGIINNSLAGELIGMIPKGWTKEFNNQFDAGDPELESLDEIEGEMGE